MNLIFTIPHSMDSQCRGGKNRESFIKYAERVPKKSGTRSFLEKEKIIVLRRKLANLFADSEKASAKAAPMYFLLPHWMSATWCSRAQISIIAELSAGNLPITRKRRQLFWWGCSMKLLVRILGQRSLDKSPHEKPPAEMQAVSQSTSFILVLHPPAYRQRGHAGNPGGHRGCDPHRRRCRIPGKR